MNDSKKRSVFKAISWRITGTIDTFIISYLITGELTYASAISITEVGTKIALYYCHERAWNKVTWSKSRHLNHRQQTHQIVPEDNAPDAP
jgi:uncharacterized membrane protein